MQSLLAAYQQSHTQALHDAQAREQAETLRADKAEELCKLLLQREEDNEARVAVAHEEMRRAQHSEREKIQSIHTMEKSNKRLTSNSIGEEEHIQQLEQLVVKLESSLTEANDTAATVKREAKAERLRANECERSLQAAEDQYHQDKRKILQLEDKIETVKKTHVEDQRRAELAEKEHGRLSVLLAAKTSGNNTGAGRSQTSPANADHMGQIVEQLLTLSAQTQELRDAMNKQTLKLDQMQENGDRASELKHIWASAERQNAKLHNAYAWLSKAIKNIEARVQEIHTAPLNQTEKHKNQAEKRKLAKQNLDRQVSRFQNHSDIDIF